MICVLLIVLFDDKGMEIVEGCAILVDIEVGCFCSVFFNFFEGLNIIVCFLCSCVENECFIEFVEEVKEMMQYVVEYDFIIVVMGC